MKKLKNGQTRNWLEAKSSNLMGVFGTKPDMSLGFDNQSIIIQNLKNGQTRNWLEAKFIDLLYIWKGLLVRLWWLTCIEFEFVFKDRG